MNTKTISNKNLIKNAKALGVEFNKEAREKRFLIVLILSAIFLAFMVAADLALDYIKSMYGKIKL